MVDLEFVLHRIGEHFALQTFVLDYRNYIELFEMEPQVVHLNLEWK